MVKSQLRASLSIKSTDSVVAIVCSVSTLDTDRKHL